jgi:hypothetical protein
MLDPFHTPHDFSRYDGLEIGPVRFVHGHDGLQDWEDLEACLPHQAQLWTVYGHLLAGGVEALEDFHTHVEAFNFAYVCVENNESLHTNGLALRF